MIETKIRAVAPDSIRLKIDLTAELSTWKQILNAMEQHGPHAGDYADFRTQLRNVVRRAEKEIAFVPGGGNRDE